MAGVSTPTSRSSTGGSVKLTPNSSPGFFSRAGASGNGSNSLSLKAPTKRQFSASTSSTFPDSSLSLRRVIGCSTNAFDSHHPTRSFAYTAGAAAVVVTLDDDLHVTQRFFRARPNAPTLTSAAAGAHLTPSSTPQSESRVRAAAFLREAGIGYTPSSAASTFGDESPNGRTWTARERIKAATCLSFSPDGKWLAVGETGYNPRVLIFSMSKDVQSDVPVAAMSEHTFGVRDVAFSPDSKYLASIGTANDGFIYVWSLNPSKPGLVQLHASNKCTSFIRQIAWMGRTLVTVGTRHVKLWRTEEDKPNASGPVVLHGRNALLGNMSDSTMSCIVGISEDKAVVCSERGDICLLEEVGMRFSKVADAGFGVHCIAVDAERKFAWVAGKNGSHSALVLANIVPPTPPASPSSSRSSSPVLPSGCRRADVVAMASMFGHLFTLDSNRSLKIINMSTVDGVPVPNSMVRELPAHKDACLGVRPLPRDHPSKAAFFTWSAGGAVLFWCLDGICKAEFQIELEQPSEGEDDVSNELKVVRVSDDGTFFVSGDKYGVLRVIDGETFEHYYDVKAHGGEIMDITMHQDTIVSCARDRTAQVFKKMNGAWALSQTLDDHTASVQRVLLLENGNKLLSCSTDRTIVIRELCHREALDGAVTDAYIPLRTLNTRASPVHLAPLSDSASTLLVSTLDRQIIKYDLTNGKIISSFKVTDETGDSVVMDAITLSEDRGKPRIIVGTSTTDKSIRLYDLTGGLVDKEWGHTEGVSDVCLLEVGKGREGGSTTVISTGTDGTIMIWDFSERGSLGVNGNGMQSSRDFEVAPQRDLTAARTPLRRVLSKTELLDFTPRGGSNGANQEFSGVSGSKSVGSASPPRPLRKKGSLYGLNKSHSALPRAGIAVQQQTQSQAQQNQSSTSSEDSLVSPSTPTTATTPTNINGGRESRKARGRTPSLPDEKTRLAAPPRRSSYDARATRGQSKTRIKSDATGNGPGSMNALAQSLTRSLRSFRKRVEQSGQADNGALRPEVMRGLQRELGLTVKTLGGDDKSGDRDGESSSGDDDAMAAMLEAYSSKLLIMVNDRLEEQFQKKEEEGLPKTNGITAAKMTVRVNGESSNGNGLDRRKSGRAEVTGEG